MAEGNKITKYYKPDWPIVILTVVTSGYIFIVPFNKIQEKGTS